MTQLKPASLTVIFYIMLTFFAVKEATAQPAAMKDMLQKKWIKSDIRMADGSTVYRPDLVYMQLQYKFLPNDSLRVTLDGRTSFEKYRIQDSTLSYGNETIRFHVRELSDVKLLLKEVTTKEETDEVEIELIPQKFHDLGFVPITYLAQNGDVVFIANENHVYPFFVNSQLPAIAFISERFDFPEWKRGNFLARFIVTKTGELTGVRVEESTNHKYDNKLVAAIKKTARMWRPAEFEGQPVTSEVVMVFKMDFPTYDAEPTAAQKVEMSAYKLSEGNYFFEQKDYNTAVEAYTVAIENDFKNVDAYYRRAASYVLLKKKAEACKDYEQLMYLEQTKATDLYNKYCK